jgi:hypothetical protein
VVAAYRPKPHGMTINGRPAGLMPTIGRQKSAGMDAGEIAFDLARGWILSGQSTRMIR